MKNEIFKVQVPLFGEPIALVYNRKRTKEGQFPIDEELMKFMDGKPKKFVYGSIKKDGKIQIETEAPWQNW